MPTLANTEVPDEMLHIAAFHLGLHCLQRQNQPSEKEILVHVQYERVLRKFVLLFIIKFQIIEREMMLQKM